MTTAPPGRPVPAGDDGDGGAPSAPEPAAGPPAPPRRRRVRILVDVVRQNDEVAYATALFEERGWTVRAARADESAVAGAARRTALAVEVRLHGARHGAVRTAVAELERLVEQATLGAWVRDAALVEHERPPRTTYAVHRALAAHGPLRTAAARLRTWLGAADEQRAVTVPAGPGSRDAARAELAARALGGREFDPSRHGLRLPGNSDTRPRDRREDLPWLVAGAAGIVLATLCGMAAVWAHGPWKALPLLLSTAGALPLGRMAKETRDRPRRVQWAAGLAGTSALAAFGALVGRDVGARGMGAGLLLLAGAAFVGTGVVLAVRRTFFTRHAAWLVPLSVPVLWSLVGWLGGQMQGAYLDRFDIRRDAVPSETLGGYAAAARPMALALGSVLLCVALVGWLRHFHLGRDGTNRFFAIVLTTLLAVSYALFAIALGTGQAARAAGRTAENAAREGIAPPAWFGLRGRFVCVRPLEAGRPIPVEYGPVVTGRPVVTFGTNGDWVWLWDPSRRGSGLPESFAVRREDVQLTPAENPAPRDCPAV